jgi:hypothetical protein
MALNDSIQVSVDEIQAWRCTPVTKEARLCVLKAQRLAQERIGVKIDLADRKIIRSAPKRMNAAQFFI